MDAKLNQINQDYATQIDQANDLKQLDEIFLSLFGKQGEITLLPKYFSDLSKEELTTIGPLFNKVKNQLQQKIEQKRLSIREQSYQKLSNEKFDINPEINIKQRSGQLHPLTTFENEIVELFSKIGFQQYDSPHIDTDYNNFEVLNIPAQHPARDLWDTLYVDSKAQKESEKLLLRTHTSNGQIRILKTLKPPIRMILIGRCFRYENLDARHEHTFDQFELMYVDKGVSMANLQYLAEYFLQNIFGPEVKVRLRPKYYPFVEPGAGIDGLCMFCKGKGCKICSGTGWLELGGAGMIHPTVLKNGGIDPKEYSGIAWGFGPPRMAMLKYGIEDIRAFNSGELRFMKGFDESK